MSSSAHLIAQKLDRQISALSMEGSVSGEDREKLEMSLYRRLSRRFSATDQPKVQVVFMMFDSHHTLICLSYEEVDRFFRAIMKLYSANRLFTSIL